MSRSNVFNINRQQCIPHTHTSRSAPQETAWSSADRAGARVWGVWVELLRADSPVPPPLNRERVYQLRHALLDLGYAELTLTLAVEGCASSRWCMGENRAGRRFDDLGWILATSERIERLAAEGQRARAWIAQQKALAEASAGDGSVACAAGEPYRLSPERRAELAQLREMLQRRARLR